MEKLVTVVVGGQFGSEAKGKVVSYLANEFDFGVRTGGPNAGHTVTNSSNLCQSQPDCTPIIIGQRLVVMPGTIFVI